MRTERLSYEEALDTVIGNDSLRARYVYESYQRHIEDETLYDLILNTERIEQAVAADLIIDASRQTEQGIFTQASRAHRLWV